MANINFDDYKKKQEEEPVIEKKEFSVGSLEVKNTQYYVEEENVLFDFIELEFGEQGIGVEVWMSFLGEDFKMKVEMMSKEEYDNLEIGEFIGFHLSENLECLKCKTGFLEELCEHTHEGEEGEKDYFD